MKKLLLVVSLLAFLAASCNSSTITSTGNNTQSQPAGQNTTSTSSEANSKSMTSNSSMPTNHNTWQGMLEVSDNASKGNYMLVNPGQTIYLHTNRDFSQLIGKAVNVNYQGNLTSFQLLNIVAK